MPAAPRRSRRRLGWAACLLAAAAAGARGEDLLGPLPPPGLYDRLVDPAEYPLYGRRAFAAPTWRTFGHRPQLVGGRSVRSIDRIPDAWLVDPPDPAAAPSPRDWFVGRVYQPNIAVLRRPDAEFGDMLEGLRRKGMMLFNVGGYGPGAALEGGYGQFQLPPERGRLLADVLGDRWLGCDLGEQDGRYHNGFESRQWPAPRDRVTAHRLFHDWCDRVIDDQGGRLSLLNVLWGWHYPTQDGAMTLIGAECESKCGITAPQVQYAFLRGAGKQHGVLWFGNVALFNSFGVQSWKLDDDGRIVVASRGSSLALMRRLFVSQWLWNCCILSVENDLLAWSRDRRQAAVSPIGRVQADVERLIQSGFTPGVMQTPVAIVQDVFSGWMPPRTNATQFRAFNSLEYSAADHLGDQLLGLVFPGYENCGWFFDESGGTCPTPHGEIADCLLSDAPAEVLSRYSLVLAAGIEHDVPGVRERLDAFCGTGGVVMATGADAARLWPDYCGRVTTPVAAGAEVVWQAGPRDPEPLAFDLHEATLPDGASVLASWAGRPVVARIPHRGGTLIVLFAASGLNREPIPVAPQRNPYTGGGENTGLERPHRLLAHAARAYESALAAERLFTAGEGLTVTTCRRPDGTFVVGVGNPGLRSRPLGLQSHVGPIASLAEVSLGGAVHDLPGYWPVAYAPFDPTAAGRYRTVLGELPGEAEPADAGRIRGGDLRVFEVTLGACTARSRPDHPLPSAPRDRLVAMPDLVSLRERLLSWPRFAACFDGVAVGVQAVADTDATWLRDHAGWFRRHGVRVVVDARGAGAEAVAACVARLAAAGGGTEVVVESPSAEIVEACRAGGIGLRSAADVRSLAAGTTPERIGGAIELLEADWRSWDGVYRDVRAAWLDEVPGRIRGPGPVPTPPEGRATAGLRRFVAVRDTGDVVQAVAERPGLLERFDGLVLQARWLEGRSRDALARDAAWLTDRGLGVIVDASGLINRFPDLTFSSGVPHQRAESVRRLDNLLDKLPVVGCRDVIVSSHPVEPVERRPPPAAGDAGPQPDLPADDWDDQRAGIERFLAEALARGIDVHWRTSQRRPPGRLADHAAFVAELRSRYPNLRLAACMTHERDPARLAANLESAGGAALWLVAAAARGDARVGERFLPLATLPRAAVTAVLDQAGKAPATSGGDTAGRASGKATVVFDADYLSWAETLADVEHVR